MRPIQNHQLFQLSKAYLLEILREPEVLFWGMIFPVLISIGLGLAFTQSADTKFRILIATNQPTELDKTLARYAQTTPTEAGNPRSLLKITDNILGNTHFSFDHTPGPAAIISLKRGEADLILTDSLGSLTYHFDPHNSQAQLAYMKLAALLQSPQTASNPGAQTTIKPLTLNGVRYSEFLIPGLVAFGMMGSIMWGISYTIIERRSQKLLRRMVATPMRKTNFLTALMLVRTAMNILEALVLFTFARLIFHVEIQGNIAALLTVFLAGNIAFTGVAILISSRTSKTEVGSGWINAVQMPMMILSGIFFSYHNFPDWSLGAIKLLPLTALTDAIRSITTEGAGWAEIIKPTLSLTIFGLLTAIIGLRRFRWF